MKRGYHFRNIVFEGGGVKGIAYTGALEVLEEKGVLDNIERCAGTSAGAITAAFFALGFSASEIKEILAETDFNMFKDSGFIVFDIFRFFKNYGWYKGEAFRKWFRKHISKKVDPDLTFSGLADLRRADNSKKELFVIGTNLDEKRSVVFSHETHPEMRIADAVRISMSIPLFFRSVRLDKDVYVDGGLYYNYPLNVFDSKDYLFDSKKFSPAPYLPFAEAIYNKETIGLRVDSVEEIAKNLGKIDSVDKDVNGFGDYAKALVEGLTEIVNRMHLHKNDWHRTIFIENNNVKATDFSLTEEQIKELVENGREGVKKYFEWFDDPKRGEERALNK